jgi:hypothetical protein
VYASIEADLIYASENALPSQREEQQKELHWHFRKAYLYQDNFAKATTLESVMAGNYSLVADYNRF